MAALNFPNNPAGQTPTNTFSPSSTPESSTNGATYLYNSTNGAWTAEGAGSGGDLYLSSVLADTALGQITFNEIILGNLTGNVTGNVTGTATTATNVAVTNAADANQNFRVPFLASTNGATISSAPLLLCDGIRVNPNKGWIFANNFQGELTSTSIANIGSITNTGGDVLLNDGTGTAGTTYIGTSTNPSGNNSLIVGSSISIPLAILGRQLTQGTIYGYSCSNFMYGGADDAALLVTTAAQNLGNWKNNISFSQRASQVSPPTETPIGSIQTQVNTRGLKIYLEGAQNGLEITPKSTAGGNQGTCITFNKRTSTLEEPAGQISAGGQGSSAFIRITSTNGSAPVSATLTDTRNVTSAAALPDPTTAIKALTPQLLTLASGITVASFPATHTRTQISTMVHGTDNAVDEEGANELVGVDHSNLIPYLTKALQALIARVEALES
jgi:hypothetical protein